MTVPDGDDRLWNMRSGMGVAVCVVLSFYLFGCGPARSGNGQARGYSELHALDSKQVGESGHALLQAKPYSKLVVEFASVAGRRPERDTISFLKKFLQAHTQKPRGIAIVEDPDLPALGGSHEPSPSELVSIEGRYRKTYSTEDTIAVFVMTLDGNDLDPQSSPRVFGRSYLSNSIVVFKDAILSDASPTDWPLLERTVLAHEVGHLFGLVNSGAAMVSGDHYDHDNSVGHCRNPHCLMYYAVYPFRSPNAFSGLVPDLDDDCLRDLQASGGRIVF